ncbi:MAG: DUF58 domain-containing protein [Oscillospiraceae bacterium]|jgi:uncharacterized protein (DUF58 family)|nr:DUF58 domain-containing protein [Oscillospiraceae bacterium]
MTIFIFLFLIMLYFVERWSLDHAFNGIEFTYRCSKLLVEPEEPFEIESVITNRQRRFVPFIKTEEFWPGEVTCLTEGVSLHTDFQGNKTHLSSVYLMPKSRLLRSVSATLPRRGRYIFKGARLKGGDFLGINAESVTVNVFDEIIVYPKAVRSPEVLSVIGGFMGDISVRRFIIEDPVLTVGMREYTGREPMKAISWPHSAKTGNLMVKQFDYTVEPSVSVLLDVENDGDSEENAALIEYAFSLTRTVCQSLEDKGMKYTFTTNATTADAFSRWSYLPEGNGARHFNTILEGIGRASYRYVESFAQLAGKLQSKRDSNRSAIIITLKLDGEKNEIIKRFEKYGGGKAFVISAQEQMI